MAIQRPDTPLAITNDDKKPKPTIKRTEVKNPDGTTTYRQSWNNETVKKQITSSNKPRSFMNNSNLSSTRKVTPNSREVTSVPIPTAAKKTEDKTPLAKIQVPVKKIDKGTILYEKQKKQGETREQYETRNKTEQERVNKNSEKARDSSSSSGSILTGKNKGATCKTC